MSIVACPSCGCQCKVPDTAAGKKVKCPRCATPFPVPAAESAPAKPQPVRDSHAATEAAARPSAAAAPPTAERRSALPIVLIAVGAVVALVMAAAGGGLLVWLLFPRSPAPPAVPTGPVAAVNNETKQTPQGPSAEEVRMKQEMQAARRRSVKNLKELAIAFQNYEAAFGQYPPAMSVGWPRTPPPNNQQRRPQPLLSWRVFLLPFLDETKLYHQFKFDEPWDSEHNKKLVAKMPKIYAPVRGAAEPGMTYYQVFVTADKDFLAAGLRTPFLPSWALVPPHNPLGPTLGGTRLPEITDGTHNTLLIVEGGEPVPWTKPADLEYDSRKPLLKLGGLFPDGFHAVAFDAEVYFITRDFKEKDLRIMVTCNDGEIISRDAVLTPLSEKDSDEKAEDGGDKAVAEFGNVRGKVTYRGLPLSGGTITFAGSKTYSAPIAADGSYDVRNVPVGAYKIAIATVPGPARDMPRFPRFPREVPGLPKDMPPKGVPPEMRLPPRGVVIPAKYGDPNTSGLTSTVVKGINTHDIRLD